MSVKQESVQQPDSFEFSALNLAWANEQIKKYPEGKRASATIPLLWRAQEQNEGWLPGPAIHYVAELLDMAPIRVMEVATFYTMFNVAPVGKFFIQLCGTTPCLLRGSDALVEVLKRRVGAQRQVTKDGLFSWLEVECLGACANAPMVQVNKDYFEDLNAEKFEKLLDDLEAGRDVTPGPQNGRSCSCPEGGATSLTDEALYRGDGDTASPVVPALSAAALSNMAGSGAATGATALEVEKSLDQTRQSLSIENDTNSPLDDGTKPLGLLKPRTGKTDDLKQIKGIGPKLEDTLNDLGIFHFDQIGAWSRDNVAWVDHYLSFKGRIDREDWIEQAKILVKTAKGESRANDKKGDD